MHPPAWTPSLTITEERQMEWCKIEKTSDISAIRHGWVDSVPSLMDNTLRRCQNWSESRNVPVESSLMAPSTPYLSAVLSSLSLTTSPSLTILHDRHLSKLRQFGLRSLHHERRRSLLPTTTRRPITPPTRALRHRNRIKPIRARTNSKKSPIPFIVNIL